MAKTPTPSKTTEELAVEALGLDSLNDPANAIANTAAALPNALGILEVVEVAKWAGFFADSKAEIFKSVGMPPSMQPFSRLTTMPDESFNGILQWPGPLPSTLHKIASEHIAPQMIIGLRVADVLRYAQLSAHFWRPGWRIELRMAGVHPTDTHKKKFREAESFIYNSNIELTDARERDAQRLTGFAKFLAAITRNTLMYDGIAIWTDMARDRRIKAYAAVDAAVIRLINPEVGYAGDKSIFAVGVNEAMQVNQKWTRDELVWSIRNPRLDPNVFGYGYSEIEVAARLIEAFSNAMELNMDAFNKNAIPPGILKLKGTFTQKQLDFINRLWSNIRKGASKNWVFPVMKVPNDGDVDVLDLSRLKGNEVYYKEFMNMLMGAFCAAYKFPTHRLGYKASGQHKDEEQDNIPGWIDEQDVGLMALLSHIETVINEYLLWPNWPELKFCFTGKSPKEDAREYESRSLAMTFDERRALADLPSLHEYVENQDFEDIEDEELEQLKFISRILGLAPVDPGMAGVYQAIVSAMIKTGDVDGQDGGAANARFPAQKDPAKSAKHSHIPGVRRRSKKEK